MSGLLTKVPEATLLFRIVVKMCSTTVGETGADLLNGTLGLGLSGTTAVVAVLRAATLAAQFAVRRYIPVLYWTVVVIISVVGTLFSDNLVDGLGVPLRLSTARFGGALAITSAAWFAVERTLSIHSIFTRRREAFSWLAILLAFALATSAGDWFAEGMSLGHLPTAAVFAGAIAAVVVARCGFRANAVAAFWIVHVLTRPLGASRGDLLSQTRHDGGLGFGTTWTSDVFLVVILLCVAVLTVQQRRQASPLPRAAGLPALD